MVAPGVSDLGEVVFGAGVSFGDCGVEPVVLGAVPGLGLAVPGVGAAVPGLGAAVPGVRGAAGGWIRVFGRSRPAVPEWPASDPALPEPVLWPTIQVPDTRTRHRTVFRSASYSFCPRSQHAVAFGRSYQDASSMLSICRVLLSASNLPTIFTCLS